ncbi:MAG TPA: hypothetical protein VEI96_06185 [Thermodesulfovibrionales bacterium]|nr:hypothetical protein [Thermodesulfovibrionales bacterium]
MREWFTVGAKLLGIYFLYWALTAFFQTISFLFPLSSRGTWASTEPLNTVIAVDSILTFCFKIAFALVLLFKTNWLADKLSFVGDMPISAGASQRTNLQIGLVLIGIFIFVSHIGQLIRVLLFLRKENEVYGPIAATQPQGLSWSKDLIVPCITISLSLILIFGARQLAQWLDRPPQTKADS